MTCKGLCLMLAVLMIMGTPAAALAQEESSPATSQLLLLYDRSNPRFAEEEVERFSRMASSLGKSLVFGDVQAFQHSLAPYDHVICYRLEDISEEALHAIVQYDGALMIFGSALMKRYLQETGRADLVLGESSFDRGVLQYVFSPSAVFETIIDVEDIARFQTEREGQGVITVQQQEYPFMSQVAGVQFTPITSLSTELAQAAVMQAWREWLWPYLDQAPDYHQYLVLDSVYPFMDAGLLLDQVDALIEEGLPFVISVMPLYENASYPAMTQFCQVLRYAQQHGGFIIMHAPIIQAVALDQEAMHAVLTEGLTSYLNQGVYPLGIEVPMQWTYDDLFLEVMRRYRTVFVYDDGTSSGFSLEAGRNQLYDNAHQLIMPVVALDDTGISYSTCYSSAVYLDASQTSVDEVRAVAALLKGERVPFQNLWELSHAVWGNELSLIYEQGTLRWNGDIMDLTFEPMPYDEDYDYQRGLISRVTISVRQQNKVLMAITVVVAVVFVLFMIHLRRWNRRSFFYMDE